MKTQSSFPPPPTGAGAAPVLVPGLGLRAGQVVAARYRVESLVRCSASCVTLNAHHVHLREPVTLELLVAYSASDRAQVAARLDKARIAARLRSAHVPRILDIGTTDDGMPFVATARLDGCTLEEELRTRGRLPHEEAVSWVLQACIGLAEAHGHGLVHGDIEPRRLFLATPESVQKDRVRDGAPARKPRSGEAVDPASRVLVVLDFGVADGVEALGEASASTWFGSPSYLSPEQLQNPTAVDHRADVWALGVLLYELIAGEAPFTADTVSSVLIAVAYDAAPLLTDAPYELARVVHRLLAKDPAARPQDVAEVARLLAPFAGPHAQDLVERVVATGDSARKLREREATTRRARTSLPAVRTEVSTAVETEPVAPAVATPVRSVAPPPRRGAPPPRAHKTKHLAPVILDAPPPSGARDSAAPFLLTQRRAHPTRPSQRVRAERSRIGRALAVGIGLASFAAVAAWALSPSRAADVSTTNTTSAALATDTPHATETTAVADGDVELSVDPGVRLYEPLPSLVSLDGVAVREAAAPEPVAPHASAHGQTAFSPSRAFYAPAPARRPPVAPPAPTTKPRSTLAPNPFGPVLPQDLPNVRSPAPAVRAAPVPSPKAPTRPANAVRAPKSETTAQAAYPFRSRR